MLQLAMDRCLALLVLLALCASLETAPPPASSPGANQEQLVRVYEINEEQYARMLQLTKGRNVISEARLINGGFATVSESFSETLSSGWHSLLRIVGLTTVSKPDEAEKVDFESQPLCVIKTREGEPLGRDENVTSARSSGKGIEAEEEDTAIHCIVVLKKDSDLELPSHEPHPNYGQYWNPPQSPQPVEDSDAVRQPEQVKEEKEEAEVTTAGSLKKKKKNKSTYPKAANQEEVNFDSDSDSDTDGSRQYAGYPLQPQYGAPYPPSSYGGYPYPSPYPNTQPFGPQGPYGQSPYGSLPPYGPQLPQQPYLPQPQYPPPPLYNPYSPQPQGYPYGYGFPYLDQSQLAQATQAIKEVEKPQAADDEDEEDEDSYEEEDDYKKRYYPYTKMYYSQPYNYRQ